MNTLVAWNHCLEEEARQAELCTRKMIAEKRLAQCDVEIDCNAADKVDDDNDR